MKIHPTITPKAAKLLQRVAKRILKYPKAYQQNDCLRCIAAHTMHINRDCKFDPWSQLPWDLICDSHNWPVPFRSDYGKSKTYESRARVGYRRIMHYLRTGE